MNLATLIKHPHVNFNHLIITFYKIHCLIQSRDMTCASLSGLTLSNLLNPMIRDNLDAYIIAHDGNIIITISS